MTRSRKKLCLALVVLFAVNVLIISLAQKADAVTYKQGSTGSVVTEIQQRLSDWGYYSGSVDGIYGSKTVAAVKYFQRSNGLTADGKCGTATLAALGINVSSAGQSTSGEVELLARLISAEARGEPYTGQVAVGAVVLNRVESPAFPSTMSGVIYQSGAFTCLSDGQFWEEVADSAYQAAQDAINGWDPSGGARRYITSIPIRQQAPGFGHGLSLRSLGITISAHDALQGREK